MNACIVCDKPIPHRGKFCVEHRLLRDKGYVFLRCEGRVVAMKAARAARALGRDRTASLEYIDKRTMDALEMVWKTLYGGRLFPREGVEGPVFSLESAENVDEQEIQVHEDTEAEKETP